jgi:outer membrane protein assembly factor BamB
VQTNIDRGKSRVLDLNLFEGVLYSISDSAMVQAVDAETGAVLWAKQIGRADHPSMPLGVGGDMLAVVNGSRLYVANRHTGDILYEHNVDGAPGGGPGVNDRRVYVPMTTGMIAAYRVDLVSDTVKEDSFGKPSTADSASSDRSEQKLRVEPGTARALFFQSKGRTLVQPLMMRYSKDEEYASWPTDQGFLYVARVNRHNDFSLEIQSRIKTDAAITVPPAYLPPTENISPDFGILFFGSNDGFVTAIREDSAVLWRIPTTEPIVQMPVSIGERVYFSTQHGGLYCVDAKPDGAGRAVQHWYAPGALRFLAAGKKYVYAADHIGNTLVLDALTGARIDTLETQKSSLKFTNFQTDRLYLATPEGLIQCLHEIGVKEPLRYDLDRKKAAESAKPTEDKKASGKAEEGVIVNKAAEKDADKGTETEEGGQTPDAGNDEADAPQTAPETGDGDNSFKEKK